MTCFNRSIRWCGVVWGLFLAAPIVLTSDADGQTFRDRLRMRSQRMRGTADGPTPDDSAPSQSMRPSVTRSSSPRLSSPRLPPAIFDLVDTDGDGEVTLKEFASISRFVSRLASENALGFAFSSLDVNNDAAIDRDEFVRYGDRNRGGDDVDPVAGPVAQNPLRFAVRQSVESDDDDASQPEWNDHWSFQPIDVKPPRFDVTGGTHDVAQWPINELDRYIAADWVERDLVPVGDADRYALVRRLYLDLIGLPPNFSQARAFADDDRPIDDVVADTVDRLLESPRFGEHWGRHWLDVARYAESSGKEVNLFYPHAWRYRDYVIDAMNADKPFDQFIVQQIAGDLLPADDSRQRAENTVATGYLAIGAKSHQTADMAKFLLDVVDEQIDTVSRGVMGLTVSCARCHDHMFDPISQRDYYALAGIFAGTETLFGGARTVQTNRTTGLAELPDDSGAKRGSNLDARERTSLERQLTFLNRTSSFNPIVAIRSETIKTKLSHYDDANRARRLAMCVRDGSPMDIPLFDRGELDGPTVVVPRGTPAAITGPVPIDIPSGASGRLELARWMVDDRNPLTPRVIANRIWGHLMGVGLVDTPDNFGITGSPPTHPELLDYLATQLIKNDWSIKSLIREVATSRTYRLSTATNEVGKTIDPDNRFHWRHTSRRLTAESIRDSILQVCGTLILNPPPGSMVHRMGPGQTRVLDRDAGDNAAFREQFAKMMGSDRSDDSFRQRIRSRMIERMQPGGTNANRPARGGTLRDTMGGGYPSNMMGGGMMGGGNFGGSNDLIAQFDSPPPYRSIYIPVIRDRPTPVLDAFDTPDPSLVTGRRETTTVAAQALLMMNDDFIWRQCDALADRYESKFANASDDIVAERLITEILLRPADDGERQTLGAYLRSFDGTRHDAIAAAAAALLATAEFRFSG